MTRPGGRAGNEGEAWIGVHADTDPFERELERGVRKGAEAGEDDMRRAGEDMGDALGDGLHERVGRRASTIHDTISRAIGKKKIKADIDFDTDEGLIPNEIERAFHQAFRRGGNVFETVNDGLGQAISSGIGAGFNVSGRGPLILLLAPFIGAIGALIAGAIQAVNALVALLTIVPSLIGAIVLQVGVLFLAFRGVGSAIAKAFAAKTPKEFEKALEGLSPPLQKFIRSLLPLRQLFNDLSDLAQRNFFTAFGTILENLAFTMRFNLALAVDRLSTAFGKLFREVATFFTTPSFQTFFAGLIDSTERWITLLGPALTELLKGFSDLGTAVKPFLDWFGTATAQSIADFGKWLQDLAKDPEFIAWLDRMKDTLKELGKLWDSIKEAVKEFFKAIDEAGGKKLIENLTYLTNQIIIFLKTDFGKQSIKALLGLLLALTYAAVILIGGFLSFLGILYYIGLAIEGLVKGIGTFFTETIPGIVDTFIEWVKSSGPRVWGAFQAAFQRAKDAVQEKIDGIKTLVEGIPGRIQGAITSLGTFLFNAGKTIIQRMIDGIREKLGPLGFIMDVAAQIIKDRTPSSPAKLGPLAGEGDPLKAGQRIIQRLAAGIKMETPALAAASSNSMNSINFGPNSVQVGFNGAVPTQQQAMMTGMAVGNGITQQLAIRNTSLAVRSMIG